MTELLVLKNRTENQSCNMSTNKGFLLQNNPPGPRSPLMFQKDDENPPEVVPHHQAALDMFNEAEERAKMDAAVNAKSKSASLCFTGWYQSCKCPFRLAIY